MQRVDVFIAMGVAGVINMAMLVIAASLFQGTGIDTIEGAHAGFGELLGPGAALAFALALLASGFAASSVGTYAGQVVMQGFINRTIPLVLRRLVTMAPALVVLGIGLDPSRSLVISQVVLSFGIPFALVPLVLLTRRRSIMGALVNRPLTTAARVGRRGADHRPERISGHSDVRLGFLDFAAGARACSPGDGGTCDAVSAGPAPAPMAFAASSACSRPPPCSARGVVIALMVIPSSRRRKRRRRPPRRRRRRRGVAPPSSA